MIKLNLFICNKSLSLYLGTHTELSCLPGSYQPNLGQGNCISCGPGNMCPYQNMSSVQPCMAGYYCPNGTLVPCPSGTYGNRSGLSSIDMCTDCPSGKYCQVMIQRRSYNACQKSLATSPFRLQMVFTSPPHPQTSSSFYIAQ